ncbi:Flagellar motor switch protein FliG [Buchnera aphidicola (Cinara piceae)]|uniref:Flagellar motor switch protein FliG n=1 Tax=Buchnera aphidicola (Cinara piceae) TaxID=1660043 RepID=A0A803GCL8_9GAMM|nr:FliG C-terminal domain-containing protein [Buchnera aphidicola]VFP87867.1 Flagellar motor switch protein FliG [Buchnera aphidicola (Cinara piceae)]
MMHLSGIQKSALLLISMDIKDSVRVLKCFSELEIKMFIDVIISFDIKIIKYFDSVIYEFYDVLKKKNIFNFDFKTYLLKMLDKTIDTDKSYKLFKNSLIKSSFLQNVSNLEKLGSKKIFILIKKENINIIAALLIYFNTQLSIQILLLFNIIKRSDILTKMINFSGLNSIGFIELNKIIHSYLNIHNNLLLEEERINKIIKIISSFRDDNIIQLVRKINTPYIDILNKIISKYFKFKNIINIEDSSIKFIINNTNIDNLCIILEYVDILIKDKFISNMSYEEYEYFKKYILKKKFISFETIYLKKNLLLKNIKKFIQDNKIIIKE